MIEWQNRSDFVSAESVDESEWMSAWGAETLYCPSAIGTP